MLLDLSDNPKLRGGIRRIVVEPIEGKIPKNSKGQPDKRITMENLNAVMDPQTCMWSFKYEQGMTPEYLRNQYTSFRKAKEALELYLKKRNMQIKEIKD